MTVAISRVREHRKSEKFADVKILIDPVLYTMLFPVRYWRNWILSRIKK